MIFKIQQKFKKIYIDKEGDRDIDFMPYDLIICQKTDSHGANQLRGIVYQVNNDSIIVLEVQSGDWSNQDIVRIGNEIDKDRQSCIVISAEGIGAPYESMISEIDSFEKWDSGAGRDFHLGNLDLVKNNRFPKMKGKGMFAQNVYLTGEFALSSGEDVGTILKANAKGLAMSVKKAEYVASLKILKDSISQKVAKDDVVSIIKQTASEITIKANKIDIDGLVPKLKATFIGVNKLDADNIDVKSLKAKFIGVNKLNADNIDFSNATGNNVNLTGNINALAGRFGKWLILNDKLVSENRSTELYADGRILLNNPVTGQKIEITNESLPAAPNANDDIYVNTTPISSSPIKQTTNESKDVEYIQYAEASSTKIATNWTSNQANKKVFTIPKGIKITCSTKGLSGFAATLDFPSNNKTPSSFKVISISITTQLCRNSDNYVVASSTSSANNYIVNFQDSDFLGIHMWGSLSQPDFDKNFEYTSTKDDKYYLKSILKIRGSFSKTYPSSYGLTGSITFLGISCSLEAGNLRSVIATDGIRIAKAAGKYFQIDTKARNKEDFVKTIWT